jgi:hypothetical protein
MRQTRALPARLPAKTLKAADSHQLSAFTLRQPAFDASPRKSSALLITENG